ncbi:NAD(P)/FAD-dependent oxidoreductase [Candidatus Woesearchaeota archaeon]|nr:NAD(P)/FAD-dependent oxidoreductase [Candidatus Woesearchaeota archaeon]
MISVIGAGYAGSYTSYLLAKNGFKVNVYEEHNNIGKPVRDTGIVTSALGDLIKIDNDFIDNEINKVKIFSEKNYLELDIKREYVLDRVRFDRYLINMAIDSGAKLFMKHKLIDFENSKKVKLRFSNNKIIEDDKLVGADGPRSIVANKSMLVTNREYLIGIEARAKLKTDETAFEIYPTLVNDFFGWIVPEGKGIVRIGIATRKNTREYFYKFLKEKNIKKIISMNGGLITVYRRDYNFSLNNLYLVGEAAGLVKNTTGGGILTGMISGQELARSLKENKSYDKLIKKRLGRELFYHDLIRKGLDKFSEKDYSELIKLLSQERIVGLIRKIKRDFPSTFVFSLLLREPRLIKFITKIIR